MLTTTRTVYSAGNQQVNRAFFETALDEGDGSRCLGDIYMATKIRRPSPRTRMRATSA